MSDAGAGQPTPPSNWIALKQLPLKARSARFSRHRAPKRRRDPDPLIPATHSAKKQGPSTLASVQQDTIPSGTTETRPRSSDVVFRSNASVDSPVGSFHSQSRRGDRNSRDSGASYAPLNHRGHTHGDQRLSFSQYSQQQRVVDNSGRLGSGHATSNTTQPAQTGKIPAPQPPQSMPSLDQDASTVIDLTLDSSDSNDTSLADYEDLATETPVRSQSSLHSARQRRDDVLPPNVSSIAVSRDRDFPDRLTVRRDGPPGRTSSNVAPVSDLLSNGRPQRPDIGDTLATLTTRSSCSEIDGHIQHRVPALESTQECPRNVINSCMMERVNSRAEPALGSSRDLSQPASHTLHTRPEPIQGHTSSSAKQASSSRAEASPRIPPISSSVGRTGAGQQVTNGTMSYSSAPKGPGTVESNMSMAQSHTGIQALEACTSSPLVPEASFALEGSHLAQHQKLSRENNARRRLKSLGASDGKHLSSGVWEILRWKDHKEQRKLIRSLELGEDGKLRFNKTIRQKYLITEAGCGLPNGAIAPNRSGPGRKPQGSAATPMVTFVEDSSAERPPSPQSVCSQTIPAQSYDPLGEPGLQQHAVTTSETDMSSTVNPGGKGPGTSIPCDTTRGVKMVPWSFYRSSLSGLSTPEMFLSSGSVSVVGSKAKGKTLGHSSPQPNDHNGDLQCPSPNGDVSKNAGSKRKTNTAELSKSSDSTSTHKRRNRSVFFEPDIFSSSPEARSNRSQEGLANKATMSVSVTGSRSSIASQNRQPSPELPGQTEPAPAVSHVMVSPSVRLMSEGKAVGRMNRGEVRCILAPDDREQPLGSDDILAPVQDSALLDSISTTKGERSTGHEIPGFQPDLVVDETDDAAVPSATNDPTAIVPLSQTARSTGSGDQGPDVQARAEKRQLSLAQRLHDERMKHFDPAVLDAAIYKQPEANPPIDLTIPLSALRKTLPTLVVSEAHRPPYINAWINGMHLKMSAAQQAAKDAEIAARPRRKFWFGKVAARKRWRKAQDRRIPPEQRPWVCCRPRDMSFMAVEDLPREVRDNPVHMEFLQWLRDDRQRRLTKAAA